MVLLFRGENAIELMKEAVGDYASPSIRNTYGDFVRDEHGKVLYFEPVVFCPSSAEAASRMLHLLCQHAVTEGGLLSGIATDTSAAGHERCLVMIKPDNFEYPCGRPGTIINIFSRTDLKISCCKIHRMSVRQAREFYGPVQKVLIEVMGRTAGRERFYQLIKFMTGYDPRDIVSKEALDRPGWAKIMVIVYEGEDAVKKLRSVLGPTDPGRAPPGTIRRELGSSMMVNTAHASDAPENAEREMRILKVAENEFCSVVERYYPVAT